MIPLTRLLGVAAVTLALATPSLAGFLNGAQWLKLSDQEQAAYVAGVYDALVTFVTTPVEAEAIAHYQSCAARAKLTPDAMAATLKTDLADDPKLQAEPMAAPVLTYLIKLCGRPLPH